VWVATSTSATPSTASSGRACQGGTGRAIAATIYPATATIAGRRTSSPMR
jgi:hypothetical protein